VITGEACPYYSFHPLVPERVHALLPNVRLILLLRDPVLRAYSHHKQEVTRGFEHLSFEDAIDAEPNRLSGEEDRLLRNPSYYSYAHQHFSYLARGSYVDQIRRWHRLFPSEQLLIVDSAALFADPDACFRRVLRFLGLNDRSLSAYPRANATSDDRMSPNIRRRLIDHFAEPNRQLEEYLGRSFSWSV
jgi:hypothetical protein